MTYLVVFHPPYCFHRTVNMDGSINVTKCMLTQSYLRPMTTLRHMKRGTIRVTGTGCVTANGGIIMTVHPINRSIFSRLRAKLSIAALVMVNLLRMWILRR